MQELQISNQHKFFVHSGLIIHIRSTKPACVVRFCAVSVPDDRPTPPLHQGASSSEENNVGGLEEKQSRSG